MHVRATWTGTLLASCLAAAACGGCGDSEKERAFAANRGSAPVFARARDLTQEKADDMLADLLDTIDTKVAVPRALEVVQTECGEINATYDPGAKRITMCDELLAEIERMWFDPALSEAKNNERILGAWRFVFFHELGHAFAHLLDLPVLGREEDVVDEFSTLLLLESGLADEALSAAGFWHKRAQASASLGLPDFVGEHSLDLQRFGSIICLVYGSDPARHADLIGPDGLDPERADRCVFAYADKQRTWQRVLAPFAR
jgi:hypothetical protein